MVVEGTSRPWRLPGKAQGLEMEPAKPCWSKRTCCKSSDNPRASYAGVHDRNDVSELALERGVKVRAALYRTEAVAVRQL